MDCSYWGDPLKRALMVGMAEMESLSETRLDGGQTDRQGQDKRLDLSSGTKRCKKISENIEPNKSQGNAKEVIELQEVHITEGEE